MTLSSATLSAGSLSDGLSSGVGLTCQTAALGDFALGGVALSGNTCPLGGGSPPVTIICQTGAFGGFALGVVTLSGNTCPLGGGQGTTTAGGAGRTRRRREELNPWTEEDDIETILGAVSALIIYAHARRLPR